MPSSTYESVIFPCIGADGFFQFGVGILIAAMYFVSQNPYNFVILEPLHWCNVPWLANFSHEQQKYIAIPYDEDGEYDKCHRFDFDFDNMTEDDFYSWNR